jgi:alpha 1,6-mannosyltransferase
MLTIRKLAFLVAGLFFVLLFISRQSPTSPSLTRNRPNRTPQTQQEARKSPSKSKDEIDRILDQANRPLKHADEFPTLRDHLAYLFPYEGAAATKFPAYIWQTWKYTPAMGEFDERFRITEATWTERHPYYVHEVISIDKCS